MAEEPAAKKVRTDADADADADADVKVKVKFLVTGCQGFLGTYIVKHILEQGHGLVGCDLGEQNGILEQILAPEQLQGLERVYGDVSDPKFVLDTVAGAKPTHIIHLAGLQIPTCKSNPVLGAKVNVIGTLNVLEAARVHGVATTVYASSAAVMGPPGDYDGGLCRDDDHHKPRTMYGYFKLCNEGSARIYHQMHGVKSVGLRPLCVYGVGREVGMTSEPTKAIKTAIVGKHGGKYALNFKGPTSWNYVKDMAAVFVGAALSKNVTGAHACNIKGVNATVEEYVSLAKEFMPDSDITIKDTAVQLPFPSDIDETELAKIFHPDPVPCTSLRDGVKEQIDMFLKLKADGRLHDRDI